MAVAGTEHGATVLQSDAHPLCHCKYKKSITILRYDTTGVGIWKLFRMFKLPFQFIKEEKVLKSIGHLFKKLIKNAI